MRDCYIFRLFSCGQVSITGHVASTPAPKIQMTIFKSNSSSSTVNVGFLICTAVRVQHHPPPDTSTTAQWHRLHRQTRGSAPTRGATHIKQHHRHVLFLRQINKPSQKKPAPFPLRPRPVSLRNTPVALATMPSLLLDPATSTLYTGFLFSFLYNKF